MTATALASLALLQLMIAMSPGPATVLTIKTAASQGLGAALGLALGLAVAIVLWAVAAVAGLAVVFEVAPWLQTGLRVAGGLFLIWIGVSLWRGAGAPLDDGVARPARGIGRAVALGVQTNLANPKALAYFTAVFVGVLPGEPTVRDAGLILAVVFAVEAVWYGLVALIFSRAGPRRVYARVRAWVDRAFGALIAGFGARVAAG